MSRQGDIIAAMDQVIMLDGGSLTIDQVRSVALDRRRVVIADIATRKLAVNRSALERIIASGSPLYGINTGFGSLSRTRIADADIRQLQLNLVRSHAAGIGAALPEPVVRAMMLVLAASLSRGISGVRPVIVQQIVDLLNAGITPRVPEVGSVGASGDLAPLAHVALVLIGEGEACVRGPTGTMEWLSGGEALRRSGHAPITLEAKEGLALINGTHLMAGSAALLCGEFEHLMEAALAAAAMSIDACRGTDAFLDRRIFDARGHDGPAAAANALRGLLAGSQIIPSHREGDARVQDPYSLRCAAVVLGAALDAMAYVRGAVKRELGAVTDNPLLLDNRDIVSAGNFHGMPVAIPLDVIGLAAAHVAGISERRTYFMLSASVPEMELSPYLSPLPGLHSGLMIAQYTAAACCNEIAALASPASVLNIPTSAGMEDYNSFGPRSAAKAARSLDLARRVVAIELICAAQGLEAHRPLRSGIGVEAAFDVVRSCVAPLTADRAPSGDIEAAAEAIAQGRFSGLLLAGAN